MRKRQLPLPPALLLIALAASARAQEAPPTPTPGSVGSAALTCEQVADFLAARAAAIHARDAAGFEAPLGPALRGHLAGLTKLIADDRFAIVGASSAMHRCDEAATGATRLLHWTMVLRLSRDGSPDATRHLLGAWIVVSGSGVDLRAELTDPEAAPPEEHEHMEGRP